MKAMSTLNKWTSRLVDRSVGRWLKTSALLLGLAGLPACGGPYAPILLFHVSNFPADALHVTVDVTQNGLTGQQSFFLSSGGHLTTVMPMGMPPTGTGTLDVQMAVTVNAAETGSAGYKVRADKVTNGSGGTGGNMGTQIFLGYACGQAPIVVGQVNDIRVTLISGSGDCQLGAL